MLACYRYFVLNPVRAGMVKQPQDYRWSNYHVNALCNVDRLIRPQAEYLRLARDDAQRRDAYRGLFRAHGEAEAVEEIRKVTNGSVALASGRFQKWIEVALGRRAQRGRSGRPLVRETGEARQRNLS